jgi:hypothetical protein
MQAKLIRDAEITHPDLKTFDDIRDLAAKFHNGEIGPDEYRAKSRIEVKAGTIIDHPKAFWLVTMGLAEPVDEQCKKAAACRMAGGQATFDGNLAAAIEGAERMEKAQITGDPMHDLSDNEVEKMKAARAAKVLAAK